MVSLDQIKTLRTETGAGIMDCRKALEEAKGDIAIARELIKKWGIAKADKKADRQTAEGLIYAYIHHGGKIGVLTEINCETDFVARTEDFKKLCHEVSMQIASMNPDGVDKLYAQEYIRDTSQTIEQLIKGVIAKLGENITVKRFVRYEISL